MPVIQTSIRRIRQLREAVGTNGQFLTIDFNEGVVYNGQQDTLVKVQEMISEINFEEGPAPQEIAFDVSVKSSQIHRALGVHPLTHITSEVGANKEKFQKALRAAILESVGSQKSRSIVYETLDLDSDDFVRMRGHEKFMEEAEINPALGFAGLDALVKDKQWNDLFQLEMQVVAELIGEGYNIAVQFNSVKVPESVEGAIVAAQKAGLPKKTQLGMNTAWPGNYLFLGQYLDHGLSFVTLNERRLAQGYLAADLYKNPSVMRFYSEDKVLPNLKRPIAMISKAVAGRNAALRTIGFTSDNAALAEQDAAPTPTSVIYRLASTLADKDKGRLVKLPSPYDVQYSFDMDELRDYKEDVEAAGRILFRAAFDSGINWRRALGIPYRNLVDIDVFSLNEDQVLFLLAAGHALGSWDLWPNEGDGRYSRAQVAGLYQLDEGTTYPVVRFKPGTQLATEFMSDAAMAAELDSYAAGMLKNNARQALQKLRGDGQGEFVRVLKDVVTNGIAKWDTDQDAAKQEIVAAVNQYTQDN
ncbi:MAG: hypothetical protein K8I00_03110, partial [Candidatus Omnitrophica bacterium]|nr:hypothetical protein [Candidatus Omnitrophota bacterium]